MKVFLKVFILIIVLVVFAVVALVLFATITKYRPPERKQLLSNERPTILSETAELSLMTWNIGYSGLGDDMDFFQDGGRKMRTSLERTLHNHIQILYFLQENQDKDLILLQEVDKKARRSYNINTLDSIRNIFTGASIIYGKNYDVRFVPKPLSAPMGHVNSGIVTVSDAAPFIAERHSYPGSYPWPNNLFNLQICFTLNRYPVENGRELVVINTHNSAFYKGELREKQMNHIKEILVEEYRKGNYVIAGGDWNQCPPNFKPDFHFNHFDTIDLVRIPKDFLPDWQWAYDNKVPTNRRLQEPYYPAETLTTLIDYFIVSPNIKI